MTKLALTKDINGVNTFSREQAQDIVSGLLARGVVDSFTVPLKYQKYEVIFSGDPGFRLWVSTTGTAAYPSGVTGSTSSELNPGALTVAGGTVISVVTSDAAMSYSASMYGVA